VRFHTVFLLSQAPGKAHNAQRLFSARRLGMALNETFFSTWTPRAQALLRIVTAYLFIAHGTAKLFGTPHVASFDNLHLFSLIGLAGTIELVGSVLLLLGLFTRPVAFIMSGEMAFAYFISHAPRNFFPILNGGDGAILYCFIFLYFAFAGAGPWSLDALWRKKT